MPQMLTHYNPILGAIRELCPTAHIAGGAVRDSLLQRPIRDIDLFLDNACADDAAKLMRSQFGYVKVGEWESYETFSDPAVSRVARFEKADEEIPVCLIGLNQAHDMEDNIERFDFGICQAGWDGERVYSDPQFSKDLNRKTFTLCRADNQPQFDYSMSRYKKMAADRYAGWTLAVPERFENLALEYAKRDTWYYSDLETKHWMFEADGPQRLKPKKR